MPLTITIADYGVGNLHSVRKALENCGAKAVVVSDMKKLLEAECIVLPGVGAFDKAMELLTPIREQLVEMLDDAVPCLGICIGSQILFERSEEGKQKGLGFYSGNVKRLKAKRVPHMGWNSVVSDDPIFAGVKSPYFYFAHSYYGAPDEDIAVGQTDYHGEFPSAFLKGNTYGTQFHPEKSSASGITFLRNFVRFAEETA
ncbi:MAG TPA: imidazole glycerol phosphate synthase subunit HisH [Methanomassiliicoccales archaeon]|nr:imidazole glycerol phosphate synthase subunit HisH [Methanomassiliicoccales archaeon]